MFPPRSCIVVLLGAASAALILLIFQPKGPTTFQHSSFDEALEEQQTRLAQDAAISPLADATITRRRMDIAPDSLTLIVQDASRRPIDGAAVFTWDDLPRRLSDGEGSPAGHTDALGSFRLEQHRDSAPPAHLSVSVVGFVPAVITYPEWGAEYEVLLQPSVGFSALVTDMSGTPLPGVVMAMSQSPLKGQSFLITDRPGPHPRENVHVAVSDAMGRIDILGLAPGEYDFRLLHTSYTWVDTNDEFPAPGMSLPRPPSEFRMSRMHGCYKKMLGGDVLAVRFSLPQHNTHWHWESVAQHMRQKLRGSSPSLVFAVYPARPPEDHFDATVFVKDRGWLRFTWSFAPLSYDDAPVEVSVLDGRPGSSVTPASSGMLTVSIRSDDGRLIDFDSMHAFGPEGLQIRIQNGIAQELPCGAYDIVTSEPFVNHELGRRRARRVEVRSTPTTLDLSMDLVSCAWRLEMPDGRQLVGPAFARVQAGTLEEILPITSGATTCLPHGPVLVDVASRHHRLPTTRMQIVPRSQRQVLTCVLQQT